ncbi:MAG: PAS domain-containing protein [Robiginitomaculum sp.]
MITGNALRHQMILPEQQALYDYWRSKCKGGNIPSRDDIDPAELGEFLPTISLVEPVSVDGGDDKYQVRLAGTDLYKIYKQEITGQFLSDMPTGSRRAYWKRVLGRVVEQAKPSAGAVRSAISGKSHMAQFWIRLPLSCDGESVTMVLGFDKFVKLSEVAASQPALEKLSA